MPQIFWLDFVWSFRFGGGALHHCILFLWFWRTKERKNRKTNEEEIASPSPSSDVTKPISGVGGLSHEENKSTTSNMSNKSMKGYALVNMSINHLQISAVYFSISVKYPEFFNNLFNWFSVVLSFDFVKLAGPGCSIGSFDFFFTMVDISVDTTFIPFFTCH